jgi:hypothetical protein
MSLDHHRSVLVVGAGGPLRQVVESWRRFEPTRRIVAHQLLWHDARSLDLGCLEEFPRDVYVVFVAYSNERLNCPRRMVAAAVEQLGYQLSCFVSPLSVVPRDWRPGENAFIGDFTVVGAGAVVGDNCWIDTRTTIGGGSKIGHSAWIGASAVLGDEVSIGENTNVASGAVIADNVKIGHSCELLMAREYSHSVADTTFIHPIFGDIRIYGSPT